ncbi:MAG: hypothetical protein CR972_03210 [Candidatus Moraniibacteriota bacterium]|nr:MAG: hypothetical protein CR972_03210 [Candidatus Moranbacteria bacterium]
MVFSITKNQKKARVIFCGLFVFLVVFDQYIKKVIVAQGKDVYVCNHGVALGIQLPQPIFLIMWGIIMILVSYFWFLAKNKSFLVQLPFLFVITGGVSNMIDRLYYGCVVDYVSFFSFSSFNFADVCISFGVFLWVRHLFFSKNTKSW